MSHEKVTDMDNWGGIHALKKYSAGIDHISQM